MITWAKTGLSEARGNPVRTALALQARQTGARATNVLEGGFIAALCSPKLLSMTAKIYLSNFDARTDDPRLREQDRGGLRSR